ncbi:MAG: YtxH domain-containing protein [Acidimicrobiales bacterium]
MRMRVGLATGFAVGYYFGARAGRERYEQLRRLLQRARRSPALQPADKPRAVVNLGVERARTFVENNLGSSLVGRWLAERKEA